MKYDYKISFDNGSFINFDRDDPININALAKERWTLLMKSSTEVYYLNIDHIVIIEERMIE